MRCERCKFENIPGQKTCIKCGSTLELKSREVNVHPPRMSKWKKPFRDLQRLMRRFKLIPQETIKLSFPVWLKEIFNDNLLGLILSIIPGLAHLIRKRFGEIKWYFLAWMVLLISGLFLYGSTAGFLCLSLAIGIHTAIAVQYGIIKDLESTAGKTVTVLIIFLTLTFIYRFTPRILVPNLTAGYSSLSIPYYKVETGDYLLAWRGLDSQDLLGRGSLVLIHPVTFYSHGQTIENKGEVIGQIIGFAGEHLEIQGNSFVVNGHKLNTDKYPVPQWLQNMNFSVTIPDNCYFVSAHYNIAAHGIKLDSSHISKVCAVKVSDIEAKAFMRWWPLLKRGFIR